MAGFTSAVGAAIGLTPLIMGATKKNRQEAAPAPTPAAPDKQATEKAEREKQLRRAVNNSRTIFTSPLGATADPNLGKKMLLG